MQDTGIKVIVFSADNGFLAEQTQFLKKQFVVQRAHSLDVLEFLTKEWDPQYFLLDGKFLSPGELNTLAMKKLKACFILLQDGSTQQDFEKYLKGGCDMLIPKNTAAPNLAHMITNHYAKWYTLAESSEGPIENRYFNGADRSYIEFDDLKIYPEEYLVKIGEKVVNTSPIQFRLLLSFINNHDQLLTRKWLQEYVWDGAKISPRSIDAQISKLKKLIPMIETYMINVYGKGYILSSSKNMSRDLFSKK
ncbi:MAG: winged helix-turn-helix domain-containing protein [Bdellovibrionales bacterium]